MTSFAARAALRLALATGSALVPDIQAQDFAAAIAATDLRQRVLSDDIIQENVSHGRV